MIRVLLSAPLCLHSRLSSRFTWWPEIWIVPPHDSWMHKQVGLFCLIQIGVLVVAIAWEVIDWNNFECKLAVCGCVKRMEQMAVITRVDVLPHHMIRKAAYRLAEKQLCFGEIATHALSFLKTRICSRLTPARCRRERRMSGMISLIM